MTGSEGVFRGFRWSYWHRVVLLSSVGWVFMYADRAVLSPVLPLVQDEWELSKSQLGLISSVFFLVYAAAQIPVGWASDWLGRRLVLLVPGFILFGLGTLATGISPSYTWILIAGAITGLGQGAYYPTQFSLSTEVVPPERRGIAAALINSGQAVGISVGLMVASVIALDHGGGWRLPFVVLSVPTILVAVLIWRGIKPGHDHPVRKPRPAGLPRSQRADIWKPRLVILYIVNFCSNYGFFVVLTWLPFYLQTSRGYVGGEIGWISSLVPWAAVPGGILISLISDHSVRRKSVAMLILPVAAVSLIALPLVQSESMLFVVLLIYGFVGKLALDPVLAAMVADTSKVENYGRVFGLFNFAGMSSSIIAPYLTGHLADSTGTLDVGFYLAAAFLVIGAIALALLRRRSPLTSEDILSV